MRNYRYQEFQFSRRKLMFVDGQIVYVCCMTNPCREDAVVEYQHTVPKGSNIYSSASDDIGAVSNILFEYTRRSLTNITDIYHAISAFGVIFQRVIGAKLCHGVPDVFFDWFLLWQPRALQSRRSGVTPSWSWSGWDGTSAPDMWDWYTSSITKIRQAQKTRTWIIWYQRKAHDSEECIPVDPTKIPPKG